MKETVLNTIQLVLSVLIVILVLIQQKGAGLSGVFGGTSNVYSTKRGIDKILHYTTIVAVILFFAFSLVRLFV